MSAPLLSVENLNCVYDDRHLIADLSFSIQSGEVLQIAGQNGSGKSTLLRILTGLFSDYQGQISWQGQPLSTVLPVAQNHILYLAHKTGINGHLTALQNLHWYQSLQPHLFEQDAALALEKVGLLGYEDVPCSTLSAGQLRRVSLARLYLSNAPLWILDEPFTALDKDFVIELEQFICQYVKQGGSVILTTHQSLNLNLDQPIGCIDLSDLAKGAQV